MKKFYILALVAAMFAACATDVTEDVAIEAPETLKVSFEESTRIQLDDNKTVWTKGDLVSVFYRSDANQQWKFQGKTGDREGILKRVSAPEATEKLSKIVAVYPYSDNYYINPETCNIEATLPAEQTYLKDSYGLDGNLLASATEFNQLYLRNVCGWLKIQLKGEGQVVKKVTLKGNNGEQVAGLIYVDSSDATATLAAERSAGGDDGVGGTLIFEDTILTEVSLNCGEGVELGTEPTAFYIALPPQTFEKGLTVEVSCSDESVMTKSTDNSITIERNTIQPMAEFEFIKPQPNNEIWYTSIDGNVVTPYESNVFGAKIVSNTYEKGKGVITFDAPVTSIGIDAFQDCYSLTNITIPDSVNSIGGWAFSGCTSLTSITIPVSVTEIGSYGFENCTSLQEMYYKGDLSAWCKINFGSEDANPMNKGAKPYLKGIELTEASIPSDITEIKKHTFAGCTSLTSATLHEGITSIGMSAFRSCISLTNINIPNSVTEIGAFAFIGCGNLESVTIGNNVTKIGSAAFSGCESLTNITIPDSVTSIEMQAFIGCSSLASITIGKNVTLIGNSAFANCTSLTRITIPDSIKEIKSWVFSNCILLTNIIIPDTVTSIGNQAFSGCKSLTNITIPDSVTLIGNEAFRGCLSLASVTIGNSVTSIGSSVFEFCTVLKEVYCRPVTPPTAEKESDSDWNTFNGIALAGLKIYVPTASVDAYKAASGWSDYADAIEPYDF